MQPDNSMNYSPKAQKQKVTELSELRRKFLAERDAERELLLTFNTSTQSADYVSTRIHQHSRKNLSALPRKEGSVRLVRRKSYKHDIKKHSTAHRRHSLSSFLQDHNDIDREENLSMHLTMQQLSETNSNDRTGSRNKTARQDFRETRAKSVVLLGGVGGAATPTKATGLRRKRRSSVSAGTRSKTQPKWLSNMSSKLGLDW